VGTGDGADIAEPRVDGRERIGVEKLKEEVKE
jgi:hypothetical protein